MKDGKFMPRDKNFAAAKGIQPLYVEAKAYPKSIYEKLLKETAVVQVLSQELFFFLQSRTLVI